MDGLLLQPDAPEERGSATFYGPHLKRPTVPVLDKPEAKCLDPHAMLLCLQISRRPNIDEDGHAQLHSQSKSWRKIGNSDYRIFL